MMLALPFEIWKKIEGFDNYDISSTGRVRNTGGWQYKYIKSFTHSKGYIGVHIYKSGKPMSFLLHRLIAIHFINKPRGKDYINHIDGNKGNNSINNLEWCTASENIKHSKYILGNNVGYKDISIVGTCLMSGNKIYFNSMSDAGRSGFQKSNLSNCIKGLRESHKGYRWEKSN